jgi:hypothetical protein
MSADHSGAERCPSGTAAPTPTWTGRLRGRDPRRAVAGGRREGRQPAGRSARQERRRQCVLTCSCCSRVRARTVGHQSGGAAPAGRRGTRQYAAARRPGPCRTRANAAAACRPGSRGPHGLRSRRPRGLGSRRHDCRSHPRTDDAQGETRSRAPLRRRTVGHDRLPTRTCVRSLGRPWPPSRTVPRHGQPGEGRHRASRLGMRMSTRGPRQSAGCQYPGRCRPARRSGLAWRIRGRRRARLRARGHVPTPRIPDRIPGRSRGYCPIPVAVDPRSLRWNPSATAGRQSPGPTTTCRPDIRARYSYRDPRWHREHHHRGHAHPTGRPTVARYQRRRRNRRVRGDYFPWIRCPCSRCCRRCANPWPTRRRYPSRDRHLHGRHYSPGRYSSLGQDCRLGQRRRDCEHRRCCHRPDGLAPNQRRRGATRCPLRPLSPTS